VSEHSARFLMSLRKFKAEYWDQKSAFMRVNMDDLAMFLRWIDERNADQPDAARALYEREAAHYRPSGTYRTTLTAEKDDGKPAPWDELSEDVRGYWQKRAADQQSVSVTTKEAQAPYVITRLVEDPAVTTDKS
jgi:hypothetical protein